MRRNVYLCNHKEFTKVIGNCFALVKIIITFVRLGYTNVLLIIFIKYE